MQVTWESGQKPNRNNLVMHIERLVYEAIEGHMGFTPAEVVIMSAPVLL